MPNPGKGEIYETSEGLVCRITIKGKERESFLLSGCKTRDEALARRELLAELAFRIDHVGIVERRVPHADVNRAVIGNRQPHRVVHATPQNERILQQLRIIPVGEHDFAKRSRL